MAEIHCSCNQCTYGEEEGCHPKPYWRLFIQGDAQYGEQNLYRVKYCPWCGDRLLPDGTTRQAAPSGEGSESETI